MTLTATWKPQRVMVEKSPEEKLAELLRKQARVTDHSEERYGKKLYMNMYIHMQIVYVASTYM